MKLHHAQEAAREVVAQLRPLCRRIEVAGSVRRQEAARQLLKRLGRGGGQ